jgi:hypothetical protein
MALVKNILVIDDLRSMQFGGKNLVTYARTLDEAFSILNNEGKDFEGWDEVYFDHDLGSSDIRPLILWMEELAFRGVVLPIKKCFIITSNPVGQTWIKSSLEKYWDVEVISGRFEFLIND